MEKRIKGRTEIRNLVTRGLNWYSGDEMKALLYEKLEVPESMVKASDRFKKFEEDVNNIGLKKEIRVLRMKYQPEEFINNIESRTRVVATLPLKRFSKWTRKLIDK
uniref:Uncharacterized protein n=1 Tax=Rhabditophanes sp. KR3021 TaxID=114890 RepID=A0AC35UGH3_9BILA